MDRLQRRHVFLLAENRFRRFGIVAGNKPGGLVANEIKIILPQNADMALLRLFGDALLRRRGDASLLLRTFDDRFGNLHRVAGLELKTRHPHALAVHPYAAAVDHRLGGAAGKRKFLRQKVLQKLGVGTVHRHRHYAG